MIGKLFSTHHEIVSSLSEDQVYGVLGKHSRGRGKNSADDSPLFQATLKPSMHQFTLLQLFDYGNRNMIRPEIVGTTKQEGSLTTIHLEFRLPKWLELLLDLTLVFNLGIFLVFLFADVSERFPKNYLLVGIPIALILFLAMSKLTFYYKSESCLSIIKALLKLTEEI